MPRNATNQEREISLALGCNPRDNTVVITQPWQVPESFYYHALRTDPSSKWSATPSDPSINPRIDSLPLLGASAAVIREIYEKRLKG